MLDIPLGGYTGNSICTELAAAIIAIMVNGPVHIGTDSQAMCDKANNILRNLQGKKQRKTKWMLVFDGDVWHHLEQAAKAKGPKSTHITKVKGHIT